MPTHICMHLPENNQACPELRPTPAAKLQHAAECVRHADGSDVHGHMRFLEEESSATNGSRSLQAITGTHSHSCWPCNAAPSPHDKGSHCTMRIGSTTKVLAKRMLKYHMSLQCTDLHAGWLDDAAAPRAHAAAERGHCHRTMPPQASRLPQEGSVSPVQPGFDSSLGSPGG